MPRNSSELMMKVFLLNELKTYSLTNRLDLLQEAIDRFQEQAEIAIEVCVLLTFRLKYSFFSF